MLIGSGPVTQAGPAVMPPSPRPNRAVLVSANGTVLLTSDKRRGFTLDPDQQSRYGLVPPLAGTTVLGESIAFGNRFTWLDASAGRFAVAICEEFNRLLTLSGPFVEALSVSHLLVPVLAPAMYQDGWQGRDAKTLSDQTGCTVLISNSLGIDAYFAPRHGGGHPPTLIAAVPPEGGHYGDTDLVCLPSRDAALPRSLRRNALTPRTMIVDALQQMVTSLLTIATSHGGGIATVPWQDVANVAGLTTNVVGRVASYLAAEGLVINLGASCIVTEVAGLTALL